MSTLEATFTTHCSPLVRAQRQPQLNEQLVQLSTKVVRQRSLGSNGNVARSTRQVSCYYEISRWLRRRRPPGARMTVCEVGFNVGHSAVVFLSALGTAGTYIGFELSEQPVVSKALALLNGSSLFPGQASLVFGDSLQQAPRYLAAHPGVKCDLLHVDGAHTIPYVAGDWRSFKERLAPDHVAFFDDISFWHPLFLKRRGKAGSPHFDPDAHLVGCLKLPGAADDEESLHLFRKQRLRGRNVTRTMIASDGFCVARRTQTADLATRWTIVRENGPAGSGEAMYRNVAAEERSRKPKVAGSEHEQVSK